MPCDGNVLHRWSLIWTPTSSHLKSRMNSWRWMMRCVCTRSCVCVVCVNACVCARMHVHDQCDYSMADLLTQHAPCANHISPLGGAENGPPPPVPETCFPYSSFLPLPIPSVCALGLGLSNPSGASATFVAPGLTTRVHMPFVCRWPPLRSLSLRPGTTLTRGEVPGMFPSFHSLCLCVLAFSACAVQRNAQSWEQL